MKLQVQAENPMEWIALKMNLAPVPMLQTQTYFTVARAIMAAAELGIFEALGEGGKTAEEVAAICKTHLRSTQQLLDCLVGLNYVRFSGGRYSLDPKMHKWLLKKHDSNIIGKLRFQLLEWDWVAKLEDFVRTGKPLDLHSSIKPAEWESYQEGMRDLSINASKELAGKLPLSKSATQMLDIGGSHGLYSVELCTKYPALHSTILDLPGAVEFASKIAARYDKTGRVHYETGNALDDDLGEAQYDLVMINNVVHHFTEEQNKALAKKIARALKPGGLYAIGEFLRMDKPGEGGVLGSTMGLYFSLTSSSGNWSEKEMSSWQSDAGLKPKSTIGLMSIPGWKVIVAGK